MALRELAETARTLVAPGKGILAADESLGTIEKRFRTIELESSESLRRAYRELLFSAPGAGEVLSGAILFDETIRQRAADGTPLVEVLERQGIVPGIKVDLGAKSLAGAPGEQVTEGLDGLRERLAEYRDLGARFTKWRAVITIGGGRPSPYAIHVNAHALGRYAALSQEAGLVPIVEPEVLMDGDHPLERCYAATRATLEAVLDELFLQRVALSGMLLKPNMVLPGAESRERASVEQAAEATVSCLREAVPAAVPGIVFLSGGQSEEQATAHLNAINALGPQPWELSFSYGRALQDTALRIWRGEDGNVAAAQEAFLRRARLVGAARSGRYSPEMEELAAA